MDNVMMVDDYQFIRRYVHELDNRVGLSAIAERLELSRDELLARVERANNVLRASENEKIVGKMNNSMEFGGIAKGLKIPSRRANGSVRKFDIDRLSGMLDRMYDTRDMVRPTKQPKKVNLSGLASMLDELT